MPLPIKKDVFNEIRHGTGNCRCERDDAGILPFLPSVPAPLSLLYRHIECCCDKDERKIYQLMKYETEKLIELGEVRCTKHFLDYYGVRYAGLFLPAFWN